MNVYQCIAAVAAEVARTGIAKGRRNQQQNYNFRGIDDVYNALAPIIARHELVIIPRVLGRECVERQSSKGGALFYVTVDVEFDFVSAKDGSKHTARTFGEAMDSADKATNKAMSAAYKYVALQVFCIPTEADNDTEATHHEVLSEAPSELLDAAEAAAREGLQAYQEFWKGLMPEARKMIGPKRHDALKATAQGVAA